MGVTTAIAERTGSTSRRSGTRLGTALLMLVLLTGCSGGRQGSGEAVAPEATSTTLQIPGYIGGCQPFEVITQDRWDPRGAAIRDSPDIHAEQVGGFKGNIHIQVDGWVEAKEAYPLNPDPYKGEQWYHFVGGGWMTRAALRSEETKYDKYAPDGGLLPALPPECRLTPQ